MDALNRPVEMIATCSPAGELCPARFRVEGADGERITVESSTLEDNIMRIRARRLSPRAIREGR